MLVNRCRRGDKFPTACCTDDRLMLLPVEIHWFTNCNCVVLNKTNLVVLSDDIDSISFRSFLANYHELYLS